MLFNMLKINKELLVGMKQNNLSDLSYLERFMRIFTHVQPGEGKSTLMLSGYACLLLLLYYILKPIREALILSEHTAEMRSYTIAIQALVLLILVIMMQLYLKLKVITTLHLLNLIKGLQLVLVVL